MKSVLSFNRDEYLALLITFLSVISFLAIWFRS